MYELNPDNFKKWMKNNSSDQENCSTIEGCEVQAKFSAKKTIKNKLKTCVLKKESQEK